MRGRISRLRLPPDGPWGRLTHRGGAALFGLIASVLIGGSAAGVSQSPTPSPAPTATSPTPTTTAPTPSTSTSP
jgi:hypothetical protein